MKIEINIKDYLSEEEIKNDCRKEKVQQAIKDYNFGSREDLQYRIEEVVHEILEEKLFHNNEEQEE